MWKFWKPGQNYDCKQGYLQGCPSFIPINLVPILHLNMVPAKQRYSFRMNGAGQQPGGDCGSTIHELEIILVGALSHCKKGEEP